MNFSSQNWHHEMGILQGKVKGKKDGNRYHPVI